MHKIINVCMCVCIRLGVCAEEIHVCGESAAIEFVRELMYTTGEEVEVRLESVMRQPHCFYLTSISDFFFFVVFLSPS